MYDLGLEECFFVLLFRKKDEKFKVKHYFRLPSFDDWYQYHRKRKFMGLSKGKDTFEFANVMQEEDIAFWDSLIIRVEGYVSKKKDIMSLDNWKEKIPTQHKLEAVVGFLAFEKEEESESVLVEGKGFEVEGDMSTELYFVVPQNGKEYKVVFSFRQPDTSDFVRFNRLTSRLQLVRTKQKNVQEMRMPADITPFVAMFDKLIVKVDGYSYNDKPLMEETDWVKKIDAHHKREVIREFFTSSLLDEDEEGKALKD